MPKWKGGRNAIPDGWEGCPSMATGFIDDRFFVFKTPFRPELNGKLPEAERFPMDSIFERLQQMNNVGYPFYMNEGFTIYCYEPCVGVRLFVHK